MKRILQMPVANHKGGITNYVLQNWKNIDRTRFIFDFATVNKTLDFSREVIDQGCKVYHLSCRHNENPQQFLTEMGAILDEGYDAVHLHTSFWTGFAVEELAIERRCPKIIVHSHSTMVDIADNEKRKSAIAMHEKLKREFSPSLATDFCACSRAAADWLFGAQIPRDKIRILYNAVDVDKFKLNREARKKYRRELGLEGCFVLGHAGRFVYQKNHNLLLDIFKAVYGELDMARLMLIGDGMLIEQTREKAKALGLEDKILFLGRRDDVPELMSAMDIFLLPSRFEGLGLVLIEAQASGLPCLASVFVPDEARVTPNLKFLPYKSDIWRDEILKLKARGFGRKDCSAIIAAAGYSLKEQIKAVEALYES